MGQKHIEKCYVEYFQHFCDFPKSISYDLASELVIKNKESPLDIDLQYILTTTQIDILKVKMSNQPFISTIFLLGLGFSPQLTESISKYYGKSDGLIKVIKENPYSLMDIEGISFKKIDNIALEIFYVPEDSPIRQRSILLNLLNVKCNQQGHLFIDINTFLKDSLKEMTFENLKIFINELIQNKKLVNENKNLYSYRNYVAEVEAARLLSEIIKNKDTPQFFKDIDSDTFIKGYEDIQTRNILNGKWKKLSWLSDKFELSDEQKEAIKKFLCNRLLMVTGQPGTGKTSVLKAFVDISKSRGLKIELMCPTGIAAKKLSSVCDHDANTIHKILKYDGISWHRSETDPIQADIIIIDEFSMVDQLLFYRLLKVLPYNKDFCLVLVGDQAQLPSVSPGNVLYELINSKSIPHVHLSKIFRQEDTSDIILNAHIINKGSGNLVNRRGDFVFKQMDDEFNILEAISQIVFKLKDQNYQVLSPTYKGVVGVTNINFTLQNLLNPEQASTKKYKNSEVIFRTGDRVMVVKNDYKNDVYNGEQGILADINFSKKTIKVNINSRIIEYYLNDAYSLIALDYCRTIHRVQSQEYDYVVFPLIKSFTIQLQRNLLYTAITRAKKKVIIIGHNEALIKAIRNNDSLKRNTILGERLKSFLG